MTTQNGCDNEECEAERARLMALVEERSALVEELQAQRAAALRSLDA